MDEQFRRFSDYKGTTGDATDGRVLGKVGANDEEQRKQRQEREDEIVDFREKFLSGANPFLAFVIEETLTKMSKMMVTDKESSSNGFDNVYIVFQK